ncbi:prepilin-type N-terminal cleavage/methylation domain-containing protein [Glaciecola sp. MH2013]|uniref:prepilin-type N-terminal cleavage/methylation domain-containing protein n=1 Tax=Glaciecola sp. MH2013 TaxID=2785524 RepID=UPI00189F1BA0|nr:prepilin-type N-terminal cleavage/methylation domain-containing protein [Glaciecola sp. MH2013]MBF7073793.1 prepilin-type N-terminal cleavage/methylation domain-containing protein [Glaciecola sp. MH2013]
MLKNNKKSGFSMVEVMVSMLIITSGSVGFVTLQSAVIKAEQNADLHQIAVELGISKLEDLSGFVDIEDTIGQFDYADIGDNTGGVQPAGDVSVAISAENLETHTFNRGWAVTDLYFVDTSGDGEPDSWVDASSPDAPIPLPAVPMQKQVTITVGWENVSGDAKSIEVNGNFAPIPVGRSTQALNETESAKDSPTVSYTPGEAPDVIAYDLGNGEKVETSKPVPDIVNNSGNISVSFETVRFSQLDSDTTKLEQEDFLTINCSCQLAGSGQGKTPAMTVLNGDQLETELGSFVEKQTGVPRDNQQAPLCTACCRDHHDTSEMISNEEFYKKDGNSPHMHYKRQSNGNFSPAINVGDEYDEVCRFKRVDGLFEMYPDWQLLDIMQFDDQYLYDDDKLNGYIDYSEDLIEASIRNSAPPIRPSDRNRTLAAGGYQYIARGIYLDRMKSSHKAEVLERIQNNDDSWKAIVPFYDVNLTLLASWATTDPTVADVTQEEIRSIVDPANNYYGTYSRGRVQAKKDGSVDLSVSSNAGNAGITGTYPVSANEAAQNRQDADIELTVDTRSSVDRFFAIIGDIECLISLNGGLYQPCETQNQKKSTFVDLTALSIVEAPNQFSCDISIPNGKATPFYSCENVSENWRGAITFNLNVPAASTTIAVENTSRTTSFGGFLEMPLGISETSTGEHNVLIRVVK